MGEQHLGNCDVAFINLIKCQEPDYRHQEAQMEKKFQLQEGSEEGKADMQEEVLNFSVFPPLHFAEGPQLPVEVMRKLDILHDSFKPSYVFMEVTMRTRAINSQS